LKHNLLGAALVVGLALAVVAGCGKKDDPITQAEKKDVAKGVAEPSIADPTGNGTRLATIKH